MIELIWKKIEEHTALALVFLLVGFGAGLFAFKYVSGIFDAEVVLRGSFVYRTEIEKTHVPIERIAQVAEELKSARSDIEILKKQNAQLSSSQNSMATSVCQRYGHEANAIIVEQQRVEQDIQSTLSPTVGVYRKDEERLLADARRVAESRKYSEQLNQQLIQVRAEIGKCGRQS